MKTPLSCLLVAVFAIGFLPWTARSAVLAGPVANPETGHLYYLLDESDWTQAEAEAVQLGGHLAAISSRAEQEWVFSTFGAFGGNTNRALWVGLHKSGSGTWAWSNGEPVTYTHWAPGEPTGAAWEDAVTLDAYRWSPPGQWNDNPHTVTRTHWFNPTDWITYHGVVEVAPRYDWVRWPTSEGGNGHFYALTVSAYTNWYEAGTEASHLGGYLASINSPQEQAFIERTFLSGLSRTNAYWLGLNDIVSEGTFVWSSGEALTFANWHTGEPHNNLGNEDAVVMNWHFNWSRGANPEAYGRWFDHPVSSTGYWYRGIIEAPILKQGFVRITNGTVQAFKSSGLGCAWGDYDRDGFWDLFFGAENSNAFFRNDRQGGFHLIGTLMPASQSTSGCAWGDYDNDGFPDLFLANRFTNNVIFRNRAGVDFVDVTPNPAGQEGDQRAGAWADYNNDGNLDVVSVRESAPTLLYMNTGNGLFSSVRSGAIPGEGRGRCCAWGDYDNDGDVDLYVGRDGPNVLFRNEGRGNFTRVTTGGPVTDTGRSWGCAWGDFDNDGFLDLFVANRASSNVLYRNNGDGTFIRASASVMGTPTGDSIGCAWADYDNDGDLDLLVTNEDSPEHFLYSNNGDGTFRRVQDSPLTSVGAALGCAWGDYDNDGFLDLAISTYDDQPNALFKNMRNGNHWLRLRCVGIHSNASAIGTKARVRAVIGTNAVWQLREISGGSGFGSQNQLDPHFGLADTEIVEIVRIEWPSGIVQEFRGVMADQTLTVVEPPLLAVGLKQPDASFEIILTSRGGFRYAIEGTSELGRAWTRLGTLSNVNGSVQFLDTSAKSAPQRFYRAVMLP